MSEYFLNLSTQVDALAHKLDIAHARLSIGHSAILNHLWHIHDKRSLREESKGILSGSSALIHG
jgi:hypothetical protein